MNVGFLLEIAAEGMPDRIAVGSRNEGVTYARLLEQAQRAARVVSSTAVGDVRPERLAMLDLNSPMLPVLLFGAAFAGVPFVPMNYRLADDRLRDLVARNAPALLVVDSPVSERLAEVPGIEVVSRAEFAERLEREPADADPAPAGDADEEIAVLLFTSGTTGPPKAAVLRNRHLTSYILSTSEFGSADESEATLVSVPPYHVAGVSAILSAVYAGRRLVYLPAFSAAEWVAAARDEAITHAMVVPTMLGRILDELEATGTDLPALTHLSYGGGPMPVPVIERAMRLLPHVNYVNAYGLTETSSTISILTPDDHREAARSDDPVGRARLGSVGRPLPTLELEIRDPFGEPVPAGETGEVWVRGEQVAGEYLGAGDRDRSEGWFPTRDSGFLDAEGYLFLSGRLDDVIVRGGENISPGEIEEVLLQHPAVDEVAVVGVRDVQWGERVVAYVVASTAATVTEEELKSHVRTRLRSTCTPEQVHFLAELPYSDTGKLLRRVLRAQAREHAGV
jgi:acyl-CoA synthetase (AMP-forming)/AMP-acid ligase II